MREGGQRGGGVSGVGGGVRVVSEVFCGGAVWW